MLMTTIRRIGSVAAFFMCLAIALWAMWMMLGAAFVGEWLQVARMLILCTAAAATAHLCLVPPSLPACGPTTRAILRTGRNGLFPRLRRISHMEPLWTAPLRFARGGR
jgi:hypothetical protein